MSKGLVVQAMKEVFADAPFWVEHTMRVLSNAEIIAQEEGFSREQRDLVELAAILHDIGAPQAKRRHGSTAAEFQEMEGPPVARSILQRLGFPAKVVERICFIVGHHHTPSAIDGLDFQVQWEADLLENLARRKPQMAQEEMQALVADNFKTHTGLRLAKERLLR